MKEFRISLAAARVNSNLNQKEFAEKMGVSLATITNWEKRKNRARRKSTKEN